MGKKKEQKADRCYGSEGWGDTSHGLVCHLGEPGPWFLSLSVNEKARCDLWTVMTKWHLYKGQLEQRKSLPHGKISPRSEQRVQTSTYVHRCGGEEGERDHTLKLH